MASLVSVPDLPEMPCSDSLEVYCTINIFAGLVVPDREAVTPALPVATPFTIPEVEIVAMFLSELAQVTREEISTEDPSA